MRTAPLHLELHCVRCVALAQREAGVEVCLQELSLLDGGEELSQHDRERVGRERGKQHTSDLPSQNNNTPHTDTDTSPRNATSTVSAAASLRIAPHCQIPCRGQHDVLLHMPPLTTHRVLGRGGAPSTSDPLTPSWQHARAEYIKQRPATRHVCPVAHIEPVPPSRTSAATNRANLKRDLSVRPKRPTTTVARVARHCLPSQNKEEMHPPPPPSLPPPLHFLCSPASSRMKPVTRIWGETAGGRARRRVGTNRGVDGLLVGLALGAQLLLGPTLLEEPISTLRRLLRSLQGQGARRKGQKRQSQR